MTRGQALREAARTLAAHGVPDPRLDAELLMAAALGMPRLALLAAREELLDEGPAAVFRGFTERRARREPLQYILGYQDFLGRRFRVGPGVLIPRPETETLCQEALHRLKGRESVLDLCTGSGAVAVSLALAMPGLRVTASDLSEAAVTTAQSNARLLGASLRVLQGDFLCPVAGERFDMILCNPPYIPRDKLPRLQREVQAEPALALDGGADGLDHYRRLFREAPAYLSEGAWLLCELGEGQGPALLSLAGEAFEETEIHRDLAGRPRVLSARRRR